MSDLFTEISKVDELKELWSKLSNREKQEFYDHINGVDFTNAELKKQAIQVIERLNEVTGKNYPIDKTGKANIDFVVSRLKAGVTINKLFAIIVVKDKQCQEGSFDYKFMRPATLFNPTRCAQYLGELRG